MDLLLKKNNENLDEITITLYLNVALDHQLNK